MAASPTGQEEIVPIEIFRDGSCGEVPKSMLKDVGLDTSPSIEV